MLPARLHCTGASMPIICLANDLQKKDQWQKNWHMARKNINFLDLQQSALDVFVGDFLIWNGEHELIDLWF